MHQGQLTYKTSRINYLRFGSGPRTAVCFHGYGEEAGSFAFLENHIGSDYTCYAIDLPFHGGTQWKEGLDFTHIDLQQIVYEIFLENDSRFATENFSDPSFRITVFGFSLGGRVALSLLQAWPRSVERIILLAPDGMKVNFWYWLATRTWAGNRFFAYTMKHPRWFFLFLKFINQLRLINASIFKFIHHFLDDRKARNLLYKRWTTLRRLKPNPKRLRSFIRANNTPVRLIYGLHDRIILPARGKKFQQGIEEQCTIVVIPAGHQVLNEKYVDYIRKALD